MVTELDSWNPVGSTLCLWLCWSAKTYLKCPGELFWLPNDLWRPKVPFPHQLGCSLLSNCFPFSDFRKSILFSATFFYFVPDLTAEPGKCSLWDLTAVKLPCPTIQFPVATLGKSTQSSTVFSHIQKPLLSLETKRSPTINTGIKTLHYAFSRLKTRSFIKPH